jgi:hypothetical protein
MIHGVGMKLGFIEFLWVRIKVFWTVQLRVINLWFLGYTGGGIMHIYSGPVKFREVLW